MIKTRLKGRGYQDKQVEAAFDFFTNELYTEPSVAIAPTGAGKSVIIALLVERLSVLDGMTLIMQPSKELLGQNFKKFLINGGQAGIYSASFGKKQIAKTTFATLGSIVEKPELFQKVKRVILDEAHLYPSDPDSMFQRFIKGLPDGVKVLGYTATPFRLVSYAFGSQLKMLDQCSPVFFKNYICVTQISEMLAGDPVTKIPYWSPIEYIKKDFNFDGLVVNSTGADYTDASLLAAAAHIEERIVEAVTKMPYTRGLVFVPTIDQAQRLSESIPNAAYISGKTAAGERAAILKAYGEGKIRTLFNVNVLAVGFDSPETDCIIMARPTMSGAMYYQQVGRVTRPHPSKAKAYVVDLVDNTVKFGRVEDFVFKISKGRLELFSNKTKITGRNLQNLVVKAAEAVAFDAVKAQPQQTLLEIGLGYEDIVLTFGKHKDKKISEVPRGWLEWAVQNLDGKPKLVKNIRLFLEQKQVAK